jgi:CRISPR-associated protein Csy1
MSEEKNNFETWEEVIINFIDNLNGENLKNEYLSLLLSNFFFNQINEAKAEEENEKKNLKKEQKKIEKIKVTHNNKKILEGYYNEFRKNDWIKDSSTRLNLIERKNNFHNIWVCRALILGEGVYPATHIAKLTHSSSGASSVWDKTITNNGQYVSTASLPRKIIDGAYPDAALSKVVKFLMLTHNGCMLADELNNGNKDTLIGIAYNEEELSEWIKGFQRILNPKPNSDTLAKQVFFPVYDNYHLLTVFKSSSLLQAIYDSHFEKTAKKNLEVFKNSRDQGKYHQGEYKQPVNVARISTTLSQPQNVSVLNGKRGGNIRLFSTQPPIWQRQLTPPIKNYSFFYAGFSYQRIKVNLEYLKDFLLRFEQIDLSIKNPKKKKWIDDWVSNIIEEILFYAASIQNLSSGWSNTENIKLKLEHQYFLDPYRDDVVFQNGRQSTDWQSVICSDFANWFNGRLKGKDKKFTPQREHTRMWKSIMEKELRDHTQMIEADSNFKNRGKQA